MRVPEENVSVPCMKAIVWIDLVNMLLWFPTFVLGVVWCIRARKLIRRTDRAVDVREAKRLGEQEDEFKLFKK